MISSIKIKLNNGQVIELSIDEARELQRELNKLFNKEFEYPKIFEDLPPEPPEYSINDPIIFYNNKSICKNPSELEDLISDNNKSICKNLSELENLMEGWFTKK
jgi:hypothetical protein